MATSYGSTSFGTFTAGPLAQAGGLTQAPTSPHSTSASASAAVPVTSPPAAPAQDLVAKLRALASQQLSTDFPNAALVQWSAVEPGTNETLNSDLLKTERAQYVCSINTNISTNDINSLVRVGKLFKQQNPSLPLACIVLTFNIEPAANELATRYKMKVYQFPSQ